MGSNVAFVTRAAPGVGGGHIMRCLSLAWALREREASVLFLVNEGAADVVPALAEADVAIVETPRDAHALRAAVRRHWSKGAAAVVFDDYTIGAPIERAFADDGAIRVVIDEEPTRVHECEILLDQTYGRSVEDYAASVALGATLLFGPRYVLLRPDYGRLRPAALARRGGDTPVRRVLIAFGLVDFGGHTLNVMTALSGRGYALDVVVGAGAPTLRALKRAAAEREDVTVHVNTPHAAELTMAADIAVGAAGTTTWERCCLGLPSVVIQAADNQRYNIAGLKETGAAVVLDDPSGAAVANAVDRLASSGAERAAVARNAAAICDGFGAQRVADVILGPLITIRHAEASDARRVWEWRRGSAHHFRMGEETAYPDHERWFAAALNDQRLQLIICEADGDPVGHVRFDLDSDDASDRRVSICIAPEARGRGLGTKCLNAACEWAAARGAVHFRAEVHQENTPSHQIFLRCDFAAVGRDGPFVLYTRPSQRKAVSP